MSQFLKKLICEEENLFLEYKSQWYWKENEKPTPNEWGEFLKDFSALVNCSEEYIEESKYLIIGIDENQKEIENRVIDVKFLQDSKYSDLVFFKNEVVKKINSFFRTDSDEEIVYNDFSISTFIIDNKKVLVFELLPTKNLLILDKDLMDKNRTEKRNNVFIRELKKINDPQVANASPEILGKLQNAITAYKVKKNKEEKKDRSIEKTINLFIQNNDIYELETPIKEKIWSENIHFELYPVKSAFHNIDFIYIYDRTSQQKTYNYLLREGLLADNAQKWIIIDNGLKKDINGILTKFKADKVYSLDEFAYEHLYKKYFEDSVYHDGKFKAQEQIKNFVEPYTSKSNEKNAFLILSEWYNQVSKPLMVIKGYGGIGKTTLVKYFLDDLFSHNSDNEVNSKILFIDSKEILDEISKQNTVNNIYDFYDALAKQKNIEKKLGKELLELSVDNGNLLIVLDGIDEVIAKLVSRFDIENFINTIYNNYSLGNEKTKIIITCRDYFWNSNIASSYKIDTLELEAFTRELAEKFFRKQFTETSKELEKCLKYADEFALSEEDKDIYIPYILDVIMDMVKQQKELGSVNRGDIETDLLNTEITNDYFIGRMCNREIAKLENLSIDLQLQVFINMAINFNGVVSHESRKKLFTNVQTTFSESLVKKFKGHPLISYQNETMTFRYDFFREFFINLYISKFFTIRDSMVLQDDFKEIMIEYIKYDNSFTEYISRRIKFDDEFQLFTISILEDLIEELKKEELLETRSLISSILILLLVSLRESNQKNDIVAKTELLVNIFGQNLEFLTLINLFGADKNNYPIFNFEGKTIKNAWFENYEYFWECKYDENTSFEDSTFKYLEPRKQISLPKIHEKLFKDCDISGIEKIIQSEKSKHETKTKQIKNNLLKIFRHFEQSGTFKEKKIDDTRKKCNTVILDKLIYNNVIEVYKNPSRPTLKQYRVLDEYHNIVKVLSQEGSCLEFEKVLQFIE
ncbi:NACHT domain-containing protein [Candidatus Marinarcus aquaticus]|uniref:NACHT domain-containing protein n=1 Tax=Candidatus Marinarcus aquaticus TaxID=2044504 RepID=A0A4Q0XQ44_9BACT|nr:NACHT domain-containing protein [Candidatus Marinarcus aquaticus]RXJ54552.1 hypothetical protein CRV04_10980 [Candidatus Marinarcus aquaticus]